MKKYYLSFLLLLALGSASGVAHAAGLPLTPVSPEPQTTVPKSSPGGLPGGDVPSAPGGLPGGDANGAGDTGGNGLVNPLNSINSLPELLTAILKGVVEIGAIFLTLMIVYVGFLFVAARGNEEKIRSARDALMWTVIGGLILLGAEAISLVIQATVKTL